MFLFETRERAFEAKFVQDKDLRFRACARRNHKLAAWAAERMALQTAVTSTTAVRTKAWTSR